MSIRAWAGILSVIVTGSILAPAETSARGGFVGGRGMSVGGMHAPIVRAPMVRPGLAAPVRPAVAPARLHAPRHAAPFAHVRARRFFTPGLWGYPWYGDYYEPYGIPAYQQPVYPDPATSYPTAAYPALYPAPYPAADTAPARERIIYVVPPAPSCSTQTYNVRSEKDGGERSINVVRC
jgi:hypothetical protein